MEKTCSKCGEITDYDGDLHCRKIFVDEMDKLLSLREVEKATNLYLSASFDNAWKEYFLRSKGWELEKLILDGVRRIKAEQRHREFLASLGAHDNGVSPVTTIKKHRTPHCYKCKYLLDNSIDIECNTCGWIVCSCGACGCGYVGQEVVDEINISQNIS